MVAAINTLRQNQILASLPDAELVQLHQQLELVDLQLGEELSQIKQPHCYLYFPLTAAISLLEAPDALHTVEVTVVGREGCSGSTVTQGDSRSIGLTLVQIGGQAMRLNATALCEQSQSLPVLMKALAQFNYLLSRMAVISVGCSQFHGPDQRVARWLLAHADRTGLHSFPFTSAFLAAQVGVPAHVTAGILNLWQTRGIVKAARAHVDITDPPALVAESCACFAKAKTATAEYVDALLRLKQGAAF
jgi:hypothetical protein